MSIMFAFNVVVILYIMISHWLAQFLFQSTVWAKRDERKLTDFLYNNVTYQAILTLLLFPLMSTVLKLAIFTVVNFILHTFLELVLSAVLNWVYAQGNTKRSHSILALEQVISLSIVFSLIALLRSA